MSNCNFPICLSPTEENSEEADKTKLQTREKPLKVSYKNKMKAKRAQQIKPGEVATVIDLQSENKENVNPFHVSENRGVEKQQEVLKKIDSKKSGDVRVDKNKTILSDSDASTKEGKITRKNVLKTRNDGEHLDNFPSISDLDDTKILKDLRRNKKMKETDGGNVVEKDKNQKVAETKVNECDKQRKENVRRKVKGKVVKTKKNSDDLFKINIETSRKDLSFMNNEPLHRNENQEKIVKEKCSKNEVRREEKDVTTDEEKRGESQATEVDEDASKEECRARRKNDAVIIDGVEILEASDSVNLVESTKQRKAEDDDRKIDEQLGKNECEEDGQKRKEKSMSLVSNDCIDEYVANEDGQQSGKENRISYVEKSGKKQFGNSGENERNAAKSPKNKQQLMLEETIEEVVASKDGVGDGPEFLNKDREHDNLEKENESAKDDYSKPPDSPIPHESNRRKNRSEDGERPNNLEKQECERKKLTRKKSSLSEFSIVNNKLSSIHNKCPAGKGDKNKRRVILGILNENKGGNRYKNDCFSCEVVARQVNEETSWLGNSPYVSFLDQDDESRRIDAFNFELAKKRSLEDYLNKVKKKKMLNEEGTLLKDKTTTKSSEDNVVDLISPVSSKVQDEVRKRKRKKLPFVKYSTEKPSQKNAEDACLLDNMSFCVTDDSSACRMNTADEIDTIITEKQDELCESFDQDMSLSTEIEIRKEKQQSQDIQNTEKQVENVGNFDSLVPFPTEIEKRVGVDECEEQNVSEKSKHQSSVLSLSSRENVEIPKRNTLHLSHTGTLIQSKPVCKRLSKNKRILIRKIYGYRVLGKGNRTVRFHDDKTTSSISAAMKMDHEQANSAEVSAKRPPPVIKIKTEPELATAAAAASGNSSSSSSSSSSNGSEEITASMAASASDTTPANPWTSTKCIFCGQLLSANDDPKLLECLHAACKHCVTSRLKENPILEADGIATDNIVRCPRCLVNCRQSMIIDNHFLSECLAASGGVGGGGADGGDGTESGEQRMADLKCGSCSETAAAVTSWCVECAEFICDICVQAHMRLKITKDHTIKPKEEAEPESNAVQQGVLPKSQLCSVHRQERLTLFCEACDRLTCRDCQLTTHRDHKYKFINEIAAETRTLISGLLSEVTYKRVLLKSAMKVIDDRQRLILEKRKELVNDITEMVVKLTNTINTRGKQLVVRLNDVCDAKQQTLNEKKQALDQLSNLTDDCIEFVNNALDQGSDMALLASKTNLTAHLQRIKSRRADIPNPEIPVRISLCLDKVPELIKVASSIGSIMVDGRTYPPSSSSGGSSTPSPAAGGSGAARLATPPAAVPPINIKTEAGHKGHPPAYESVAPPPPLQQAPSLAGGGAQAAAILNPQHQQQLMSRHYTSPPQQQQQMSPAAVYQQQSRTSPLQSMAQMPQQIARNLQQRAHHNQGAVSMTRVGGGPHQQQVTSSTDGGVRGAGGGDGGLRSMLSLHYHQQQQHQQHQQQLQQQQLHQQQQAAHQQFMANHAMRTTSPQNPQIYVQHRLGGGAPNVIVTASSTQPGYLPPPQGHPPHMVAAQPRYPSPYQAQMAQQAHSRPPAGSYSSTARQLVQRVQSPHSSNQQQQQQSRQSQSPAAATAGILWHIPQSQAAAAKQQSQSSTTAVAAPPPPPLIQLPLDQDTSFKITLKQQINSQTAPSSGSKTPAAGGTSGAGGAGGGVAVTSSVPKTPSPRLSTKASDDAEKCLDKFCQDSVNDLMMTIAKLDSQGTEMIPEVVGGETNGTPQVDSSTDSSAVPPSPLPRPASTSNTQGNSNAHRQGQSQRESQKDDPNEDWCAVCLDGGEPVLCCDYCPKVFHIKCHIPRIPDFPDESDPWQCLLCTDMVPLSNKVAEAGVKRKASTALTSEEQKLVERILLELYCQYDPSLHFREIVSPENTGYYEVIKKPMSFEKVRQKLDPADTTVEKYTCVEDVISDIRLIFKNAYIYNSINSQVYTDAKTLEELLDQMLEKWIPALAAEPGSTPSANNQPAEEEEAVAEEEAAAEEEAEDEEEEDEEDEENEDGHPPAAKRVRRAVSD